MNRYIKSSQFQSSNKSWQSAAESEIIILLDKAKELFNESQSYELEMRIGSFENGTFISGIDAIWWGKFKKYFTKGTKLLNIKPINPNPDEIIEYVYNSDIKERIINGTEIHTIYKKLYQGNDFKLNNSYYDLRFRLNLECPSKITIHDQLRFIRLKERYSFIDNDIWKWDFTIVWEGTNINQACQASPKYEIEIECQLKNNTSSQNIAKEYLHRCNILLRPPPGVYPSTNNFNTDEYNPSFPDLNFSKKRPLYSSEEHKIYKRQNNG